MCVSLVPLFCVFIHVILDILRENGHVVDSNLHILSIRNYIRLNTEGGTK